jgi:hypothetical protein
MSSQANRALSAKLPKLHQHKHEYYTQLSLSAAIHQSKVQITRPTLSQERQEQRNRLRKHF